MELWLRSSNVLIVGRHGVREIRQGSCEIALRVQGAVIWHDCRALSEACEWHDVGQPSLLIAR